VSHSLSLGLLALGLLTPGGCAVVIGTVIVAAIVVGVLAAIPPILRRRNVLRRTSPST
jgi:hypothetical protein